jgi:hypothetical protein
LCAHLGGSVRVTFVCRKKPFCTSYYTHDASLGPHATVATTQRRACRLGSVHGHLDGSATVRPAYDDVLSRCPRRSCRDPGIHDVSLDGDTTTRWPDRSAPARGQAKPICKDRRYVKQGTVLPSVYYFVYSIYIYFIKYGSYSRLLILVALFCLRARAFWSTRAGRHNSRLSATTRLWPTHHPRHGLDKKDRRCQSNRPQYTIDVFHAVDLQQCADDLSAPRAQHDFMSCCRLPRPPTLGSTWACLGDLLLHHVCAGDLFNVFTARHNSSSRQRLRSDLGCTQAKCYF